MRNVLSSDSAPDFGVPQGVVKIRIDSSTGLQSDAFADGTSTFDEYFKEGSHPADYTGRGSLLRQISPHLSDVKVGGDAKKPAGSRIYDPVQD
jgi:membrane carboxypeptidase/penicillin-binding protein